MQRQDACEKYLDTESSVSRNETITACELWKKIKSGSILIFLGWGDGINADKEIKGDYFRKIKEDVTFGNLRFDIVEREFSMSHLCLWFSYKNFCSKLSFQEYMHNKNICSWASLVSPAGKESACNMGSPG